MKNNNTAILIIVGLIVLGLGVLFWFGGTDTRERRRWTANFDEKSAEPYGMAIFYELLKSTYKLEPLSDRLPTQLPKDETAKNNLYIYIGGEPKYTEEEAEHLLRFVENGGTAFIACQAMPDSLMQFLYYYEDCGFDAQTDIRAWQWTSYQDSAVVNFTHPKLAMKEPLSIVFPTDDNSWNRPKWAYFPTQNICEQTTYPIAMLGTINFSQNLNQINGEDDRNPRYKEANFIRFQTKGGYFYMHTNPHLFTNFFLQQEAIFEYANSILGHFSPNTIYWDKVSHLPAVKKKREAPRENRVERNPMEYIYSQTPLRNAWYLLLAAGVLYMIFGAKRRQRPIPILEPNRNTSLEFVETVGRLYYQQQNHKVIFQKLMNHFLAHIRQRYHLVTRDLDDKLVEKICVRADAPAEVVKPIFDKYRSLNQKLQNRTITLSTEALNDFYYLVERFHRFEKNNVFNEDKRTAISAKVKI